MGIEHGTRTQRAWNLVRRYVMRHSHLPREQLFRQALQYPCTDLYSDDDAIAEVILKDFDRAWDSEVCVKLASRFEFVRQRSATPDYAAICSITQCSGKNTKLKQLYWWASGIGCWEAQACREGLQGRHKRA